MGRSLSRAECGSFRGRCRKPAYFLHRDGRSQEHPSHRHARHCRLRNVRPGIGNRTGHTSQNGISVFRPASRFQTKLMNKAIYRRRALTESELTSANRLKQTSGTPGRKRTPLDPAGIRLPLRHRRCTLWTVFRPLSRQVRVPNRLDPKCRQPTSRPIIFYLGMVPILTPPIPIRLDFIWARIGGWTGAVCCSNPRLMRANRSKRAFSATTPLEHICKHVHTFNIHSIFYVCFDTCLYRYVN